MNQTKISGSEINAKIMKFVEEIGFRPFSFKIIIGNTQMFLAKLIGFYANKNATAT